MNIVDIITSGSLLGYYQGVGFIILGLILIFKKNWIRKTQKFQEKIGTRRIAMPSRRGIGPLR